MIQYKAKQENMFHTARGAKAALLFLKQKRILEVPSSLPQRMGIADYELVISTISVIPRLISVLKLAYKDSGVG